MRVSQFRSFQEFAEAYRREYDADTRRQVENIYHRLVDEGATEHDAFEQSEYFGELRASAREEHIQLAKAWTDPSGKVH